VVFGEEPQRTWCYFYEKAALARQQGDWQEAARLGDQALSAGYRARDFSEWLPFLEGYAYSGRFEEASRLISVVGEVKYLKSQVCSRLEKALPAEKDQSVRQGQKYMLENLCGVR
jgi:hypothetical protein